MVQWSEPLCFHTNQGNKIPQAIQSKKKKNGHLKGTGLRIFSPCFMDMTERLTLYVPGYVPVFPDL